MRNTHGLLSDLEAEVGGGDGTGGGGDRPQGAVLVSGLGGLAQHEWGRAEGGHAQTRVAEASEQADLPFAHLLRSFVES